MEVRFEQADARVAQHLAIDEGAEITVRDRVMRADRRPVQLRLEEAGHPLGSVAEQVGARMPTPGGQRHGPRR
ncbi:hypothetical protein [Amycolatopsis sp. NPDC004079]|uniref:hypothetical protein n=1 Tax=Amycolatopsis sp. NPDC004079 TaxID=3154549 RepID=UPI0033AD0F89